MNTNESILATLPQKYPSSDLVYRLLKRAKIRGEIQTRKSVQEGKPDRIKELLEEAAVEIEELRTLVLKGSNYVYSGTDYIEP